MDKHEILKKYFGHSEFRNRQSEIIDSLLSGNDVLAIMPTGAGKSICYQIPALLMDGVTIVISPLISLMKDQVATLVQMGVKAAFINSALTPAQCNLAIDRACNGMYKIIYIAPERLFSYDIQRLVSSVTISMIAVDEAHCVSMWGQDFRPSYLKISEFVESLSYRPVIGAFTATATKMVSYDILSMLKLNNPLKITTGFDRKNLHFSVKFPKDKKQALDDFILENKDKTGIIYCNTRKSVEDVYEYLSQIDIPVAKYHAGLSSDQRRQSQEDFTYDRKNVIVATNAFGMGIDKSNVSFVVHYNMPSSIESYYQEAGRAGRDGSPAKCVLFYSGMDVRINRFLIQNDKQSSDGNVDGQTDQLLKAKALEKLNLMCDYCNTRECLRSYILNYFDEQYAGKCDNCLNCMTNFDVLDQVLVPQKTKKKPLVKNPTLQTEYATNPLFIKLKNLRYVIAQKQGVAAYTIFSDASLYDMCQKMPKSLDEFSQISGVGEVKLKKYGQRFLDAINNIY